MFAFTCGNLYRYVEDKRRWLEGTHLTTPFTQAFHTTNNITSACIVDGTITVGLVGTFHHNVILQARSRVDGSRYGPYNPRE